jgi:hypothetical protein
MPLLTLGIHTTLLTGHQARLQLLHARDALAVTLAAD